MIFNIDPQETPLISMAGRTSVNHTYFEWLNDSLAAASGSNFAVEGDEQVQFMQDWLSAHDWFVTSVYLDQEWLDAELPMFDIMRENGFMEEDEENPRFEILTP